MLIQLGKFEESSQYSLIIFLKFTWTSKILSSIPYFYNRFQIENHMVVKFLAIRFTFHTVLITTFTEETLDTILLLYPDICILRY